MGLECWAVVQLIINVFSLIAVPGILYFTFRMNREDNERILKLAKSKRKDDLFPTRYKFYLELESFFKKTDFTKLPEIACPKCRYLVTKCQFLLCFEDATQLAAMLTQRKKDSQYKPTLFYLFGKYLKLDKHD